MRIRILFATLLLAAACATTARAQELPPIESLLPASDEIPGWKTDGQYYLYGPDNLWEYIDGSAENFLSFDFKQVIVQDYLSQKAGGGLKVEIYRHGSPLMAYGIYAQMRSADLAFLDIGNEAFADEYSVNFWKGDYYVRVAVFDTSAVLAGATRAFARTIAARIAKPGELPAEASCFPSEGLVEKETRFLTQGVLGREMYPPSLVATYRWENEEAKLYLSTLPDSIAARNAFDWYTKMIPGESGPFDTGQGTCVQSYCKDPYQGAVMSFQFGRWFGTLVGLEKPEERGRPLIRQMVENLKLIQGY